MLVITITGLIVSIHYYLVEKNKKEEERDNNVVRDSTIGIIVSSVLLFLTIVLYLIYSRKTKPSKNVQFTPPPRKFEEERQLPGYSTSENTPYIEEGLETPLLNKKIQPLKLRFLELGDEDVVLTEGSSEYDKYSDPKYKDPKYKMKPK